VPPIPEPPKVRTGYGPVTPLEFGDVGRVNLPGLNPGFITNVPRQYEPSGVRSQFYYGAHPYQPGPTFDRALYQQVPAPVAPWGLQQMYDPRTQTIQNLLAGVRKASAQAPYSIPQAPRV
jgi:hypothetical protein